MPKDKDFLSHAECIDGDNDDDFNMNSEENIASLDPHLSEDEIDEGELVKTTYMHFIQVLATVMFALDREMLPYLLVKDLILQVSLQGLILQFLCSFSILLESILLSC
ncbi:hypothetical protein SORBI_3001G150033 [Sorghum bicolor]|uniref:Uncharacterized protein n=1 Tax=Sorghum bicolor TaxID=4558 RepID=A0A1Z5S5P2_SORBI|nr:hypothetical protein SORBI_3001G150033 [Sorghum bicolor]